ncbi:MAG TPA: DUF2254 domain-containing protein [Xanthobacteraceae bacterium]|nr:DUF2254 domain-containing protein [Xanthobacteraceae bacterium]
MRLWLIPLAYVIASTVCGFTLPRLEHAYLDAYEFDMSVASAQAFLSAVASGMIALTAIVFSIAFVMVQFSAIAYSPRLVLWFARDESLYHSLGVFIATFFYSLATLAWVDRRGAGKVPALSSALVAVLLVISMLLFARLVQRLNNLQITSVLKMVGDRGRSVIRDMFQRFDEMRADGQVGPSPADLGPATQIVTYSGPPRTIAELDVPRLVRQAQQARGIIAMTSAVGDTIIDGSPLLAVHGGGSIRERDLLRAIHLTTERTFEQDPKYPLRLLVDIAIKALSPAINDPTTAVQAIDQIEDLLRRLGRRALDAGYARDADGKLRLVYPMPTWEDYLTLAFDEIRQYGTTSVQVMRRLRAALTELAAVQTDIARAEAVYRYLKHLDVSIETSPFDAEDRIKARQEDRQGLGLTRKRAEPKPPAT